MATYTVEDIEVRGGVSRATLCEVDVPKNKTHMDFVTDIYSPTVADIITLRYSETAEKKSKCAFHGYRMPCGNFGSAGGLIFPWPPSHSLETCVSVFRTTNLTAQPPKRFRNA